MGIGEWEETRGRGVCMCFWDGNDGDSDAFVSLLALHHCTTYFFFVELIMFLIQYFDFSLYNKEKLNFIFEK